MAAILSRPQCVLRFARMWVNLSFASIFFHLLRFQWDHCVFEITCQLKKEVFTYTGWSFITLAKSDIQLTLDMLFFSDTKNNNRFAFYIISQHSDGTESWNPSLWRPRSCLFCIFDLMDADHLAIQRARASAAMLLNWFFLNVLISAAVNQQVNSLRPRDVISCQWSWSILVQVLACWLVEPCHCLNQCWLIINGTLENQSFNNISTNI